MRKYALTVAALALAVVGLTGCDNGTGEESSAASLPAPPAVTTTTEAPDGLVSPSEPAASEAGGSVGALVRVIDTASLGQVLVDSQGRAIYRYDKDRRDPSRSNCSATCLKKWTPVQFEGARNVEGVSAGLIGKVVRADGTEQLTVNGWPTYTYINDKDPGEVTGNGVGKLFWAFGPDGKKAQAIAAGNGGY